LLPIELARFTTFSDSILLGRLWRAGFLLHILCGHHIQEKPKQVMLHEKRESFPKTAKQYGIKEKMGHQAVCHKKLIISKR